MLGEEEGDVGPLVDAEGEHARRGRTEFGLPLVDELHARGAVLRPREILDLEVAEIAELLGDPVVEVVRGLDIAARADPAKRGVGREGRQREAALKQRRRGAAGGELKQPAPADRRGVELSHEPFPGL